MEGNLTILNATFIEYGQSYIESGIGQLFVKFNWTGTSFCPPWIRLSIEGHENWWGSGQYVINQTGNKYPLIWDNFPPLSNYSIDAQVELAFFTAPGTVPFKTAFFPVADINTMRPIDYPY